MRTPEILNIVLLVSASLITVISLARLYYNIRTAKNIKVTRKDNGKSVTVSRSLNRKEIHDLAELVK